MIDDQDPFSSNVIFTRYARGSTRLRSILLKTC